MQCRICGSKQLELVRANVRGEGTNKHYDLYRCQSCETTFTHPWMSEKQAKDYYAQQFIAFNGEGSNQLISDYEANKPDYWRKLKLANRLKEIRTYSPKLKSLMDIGCGAGIFLDYMSFHGVKVSGVEISPFGYKTAKKLVKGKIYNKPLQDIQKLESKHDVITMYDVLEHSLDPVRDLKIIHNNLNKNGVLVVNVPNFDSLISKAAGKMWNKLIPPNHTLHFNKNSVTKLLETNGFKVVKVRSNSGSSAETMSQLAVSLWRLPAKYSKQVNEAFEAKDLPLKSKKAVGVISIKTTQKVFYKLGFLGYFVKPVLNIFGAGEGLRVIAKKVG